MEANEVPLREDIDPEEVEITRGFISKDERIAEEATRRFVEKYYLMLRGLARYWLGSTVRFLNDEDIVQETLKALIEQKDRIDPSKGIKRYAIRIAKNKALSARRKAKLQTELPGFGSEQKDAIRDWISLLVDADADASAKLAREDCIEGFEEAKEMLGPYKSEVWIVSRMGRTSSDGQQHFMTYNELAEIYGKTERTIKRWIRDFVTALKSNPLVRPCFGLMD